MTVQISEPLPAIKERDLSVAELRIGVIFPEQLQSFLLKTNGGRPNPNQFDFKDTQDRADASCVEWFTGIYANNDTLAVPYSYERDIEAAARVFKIKEQRLPVELLAIGRDGLGNLICIAVSGVHLGKIFFWDHENEVDPDEDEQPLDWWRNVCLVANSFNEFLDKLHD